MNTKKLNSSPTGPKDPSVLDHEMHATKGFRDRFDQWLDRQIDRQIRLANADANKRKELTRGKKRAAWAEKIISRHRRQINGYLGRLGALVKKEISLNEEGKAYFRCKSFTVVLELVEDTSGTLNLCSTIFQLDITGNCSAVVWKAMELNNMEGKLTVGITMGLHANAITMSYSTLVGELRFQEFRAAFENFLMKATMVIEQLEAANSTT